MFASACNLLFSLSPSCRTVLSNGSLPTNISGPDVLLAHQLLPPNSHQRLRGWVWSDTTLLPCFPIADSFVSTLLAGAPFLFRRQRHYSRISPSLSTLNPHPPPRTGPCPRKLRRSSSLVIRLFPRSGLGPSNRT